MTEIIENALIIQNYAGFFSKDLTRHQYVFASWNPSKQGKDEKYQQDIIELSSSNHQAIAKTDTDTDTDSDTDSDTEKKQSKI